MSVSTNPARLQDLAPIAPKLAAPAQTFDFDLAVVGLGYVGLPTTLAFRETGHRVLALDASPARLAAVANQDVDLLQEDRCRLVRALADPTFELTQDASRLGRAAAVVICVPTPVDDYLVPDLTILKKACATVVENAVPGQVILLTSTTYVGSTWDLLGAPLTASGFDVGKDISVAFSPERINPGADSFAHEDVPRVVGGITRSCGDAAAALLATSVREIYVASSAETAEMCKLLENTFRAVNIALANEFADICNSLSLNVKEVIDAASTKPYGYMPFLPGPGVGGHCIPCDPHYLLWQMKKARLNSPVIEQAMNAISVRPRRVVERAIHALAERDRYIHTAKVLVVGLAYKPDVADLRQSPALEIISGLLSEGAEVHFYDPRFETLSLPGHQMLYGVADPRSVDADLTIVHTTHSDVDLAWLADEKIVLDTTYRLTDLPQLVRL
ncbi:nucleotide sugar dehydrogenase [Arthrobacter pigmenti]|uniref:Nucleotide sugar dehydrogenase n=1 Tax=Arthrobacter pigmenti TaxID=271432 RepID=A0A846RPZ2_9MICC|nr:nucleotide sugar dehydrogenase [Arthrobacter pigmenti]NJC22652.1 nucleotide sugar dehydrogenase [Arthrobacter pigmenti]